MTLKQIYIISKQPLPDNPIVNFIKTGNYKYSELLLTSDIISDLAKAYDNDLPVFFIESSYQFNLDNKTIDWEQINKPMFVKECFDKYSYYKLFYLPYYLIKTENKIEILKLDEVAENQLVLNSCIKNSYDKNTFVKYINSISECKINTFFTNVISDKYNIFYNTCIKEAIKDDMTKSQKWLIYYFYAIAYFHNENFKLSREYLTKAISNISSKLETYYIQSKILFANEDFDKCSKLLSKIYKIDSETNMLTYREICTFNINYLYLLTNIKLNNHILSIDIANDLLDSNNCPDKFSKIIIHYINKLQIDKTEPICDKLISLGQKYTNSTYDNSTHFKLYDKDDNVTDIKWDKSKISIINEEEVNLDAREINCLSCVRHKDTHILLMTSLYPLIINRIDDSKLVKLIQHETYSFLKNYTFVSKFVLYNNVYLSIITFKSSFISSNQKLYRIFCINKDNLRPTSLSPILKIDIDKIKDIFIVSDHLIIIGSNKNQFVSLCKLYINENLEIDYIPKVELHTEEHISLNIKCPDYIIPIKEYKNYKLDKDNAKYSIVYDLNNEIVTNTKTFYSQLIKDFIYLPENIKLKDKTHDIAFYSDTTDILLNNFLKEQDVTITDDYRIAKYLIITTYELENLSFKSLSDIITNKTLIITLLEEEEIDNITNIKYKTNEYLNKLYIFNIVKNDDYTEFIYNKIIMDEQYLARQEYFDIDINNIYNNTNIYEYSLKFICDEEIISKKINIETTQNDYKIELINKLHRKTENTVLIEVLKFIIYNDQDIVIFTEEDEVPELIFKLNILGSFYNLNEIDTETYIGTKCIILLKNETNLKEWKHLYNSESLIYILDDNKLIYPSQANS